MPPRKPALDRSYHYPLEVLELLVATIPRLIKTRAGILEFFAEAGSPKELIAEWRAKLHQGRMGVSSKYHLVRGFLRDLNTLGDDGQAVREEVLCRLARHADFSTGWEDDRQRAEELVTRIRELVGGTDAMPPAACQEALTRQAHLKTDHARPKDNEHHSEAIETLKSDLDRALRAADPSERSTILGTVLPGLFRCHGVATRQVPAAPLTDAAVLIDFEEALFLVELRCSAKPLDFRQLAPHLVMLYGCPDQRGLLISSSGFTDQTLRELGSILPQRLFLCQLDELAQLLHEQGRSLREWLRTKFRAAETEQKPFVRVRVRGA